MPDKKFFKNKRLSDGERRKKKKTSQPCNYLIVCEGTKTEPNYFDKIKQIIEAKYRTQIRIEIKGTGRNTLSLVKYTEQIINRASAEYAEVWIVMDKDDFPNDNFNNAISRAESEGFKLAWSNEAVELWFLLHFEYINSAVKRTHYNRRLNHYFKQNGLIKYEKNNKDIFEILTKYGNMEFAITNAKKLYEQYENADVKSCASSMNPCTTVYMLVEELNRYMLK